MNTKYIRGLSVEQIKKMEKNTKKTPVVTTSQPKKIINSKSRFFKRTITKKPLIQSVSGVYEKIIRPSNQYLTSILNKVTRLDLPEKGSFNAGLIKFPNSQDYILVYRPDENRFIGCILSENLEIKNDSYFRFHITNCADPRLIWTPDNKLLMVYSSINETGINYECIRGAIIMDLNVSEQFIDAKPFRISPYCETRHKNWMPFIHDEKIYLIASVCPHVIYELKFEPNNKIVCEKVFETKWLNPWMFKDFLRGNTPPVLLDDNNYISTFHTSTWYKGRCFYDNGAYIFEGKPPFNVLKCANRTYLKAEDACEPHFRKRDLIVCNFPVGMVKKDDNLLISYGDNDSVVKIMEVKIDDMLNLMLEVY